MTKDTTPEKLDTLLPFLLLIFVCVSLYLFGALIKKKKKKKAESFQTLSGTNPSLVM